MCHTIPFCKNKQGTYTMHMISWEWMKKVSTPEYQSQFCHIGNIALQSFANNPGWLFLGGDFSGGKITLMDAFVAVTSVTQMAAQNTSHCGFDMFLTIVAANLSAWHLQKMETKAHRQLLPLFRATTVWPSKDSKCCISVSVIDIYCIKFVSYHSKIFQTIHCKSTSNCNHCIKFKLN